MSDTPRMDWAIQVSPQAAYIEGRKLEEEFFSEKKRADREEADRIAAYTELDRVRSLLARAQGERDGLKERAEKAEAELAELRAAVKPGDMAMTLERDLRSAR